MEKMRNFSGLLRIAENPRQPRSWIVMLWLLLLASPVEFDLKIQGCHDGDAAVVQIVPERGCGGWFLVTNGVIRKGDAVWSMIPSGTNTLRIATVCGGRTGEVRSVRVKVSHPPPAPRVTKAIEMPMPPVPPGFAPALQPATNYASYAVYRARMLDGRRRSQ